MPDLAITAIRAKVDTGARSSALHTRFIEPFEQDGVSMVRFALRPHKGWPDHNVECQAVVCDQREVKSSSGERETRYFIRTPVQIGNRIWKVELSLTDRSTMKYRMLLGRQALRRRVLVDPSESFITRTPPKRHPA